MFKVVVTGDRDWKDKSLIREAFDLLPRDTLIIHGGARGLDTMAGIIAQFEYDFQVQVLKANWEKHGKAAGPIRNRVMLDLIPDFVLGFHNYLANSKGTKDCIKEAVRRGLNVEVFGDPNWKECL